MTAACDQLAAYVDGELAAPEREAFALHVASCAECRRDLHDLLQLAAIEATARAEAPAPRAEVPAAAAPATPATARARPRWWRRGSTFSIALAAAAAVVAAVWWLRRDAAPTAPPTRPPEQVALASAPERSFEGRISYGPADRYRRYAVARGGNAVPEQVALDTLAGLERRDDLHGVAAGYLLMSDATRAVAYLDRAGASPDVACDRALAALEAGHPGDALIGFDAVLDAVPHHAQALWNRALALRDLGLTASAAEAFEQVAALGEPGWADEARARAQALSAELATRKAAFQRLAFQIGPRLAAAPDAIDPPLARRFPGMARLLVYDAVRSAGSADAARALAPVAGVLDGIYGGDVLSHDVARAAASDFTKRGPLAARYAALLAGARLDPAAAAALLADLRAAHQDDILLGAIVVTSGGHTPDALLPELHRLASASGDPWFALLAVEQSAQALAARGDHAAAETAALPALAQCAASPLDYRCASLDLVLGDSYLTTLRLSDARRVLADGWSRAIRAGEWNLEQRFLPLLAQLEAFEDDVAGTRLALVRAYATEMRLRDPSRCELDVWGRNLVATVLVNRVDLAGARAELARANAVARTCPAAAPSPASVFLAAHVLRDPAAPPADVAALRAEIATLRRAASPTDRIVLDQSEGRLLIDRDRTAASALLQRAIDAARGTADVDAQKARSYAYSILTLDAGRAGEWTRVWQLLGADAQLAPPATCALGAAAEDRRSVVVVRDGSGAEAGVFDAALPGPAVDAADLVPAALLDRLQRCAAIDVLARPPISGMPDLLPPELAWSYRGAATPSSGPIATSRLVIAGAEPPPALGLPRLAPWRSAAPADVELDGPAATPTRVLAELAHAGYVEVHAHGLVDAARADGSFLALSPDADGRFALTAAEIRAQPLAGHPIVVLAACHAAQAATYRHESWSLPAAFLAAGASAVIASPDVIADADAGAFFEDLRARLARGLSPAVALRDARVAWLAGHPTASWVRSLMVFR